MAFFRSDDQGLTWTRLDDDSHRFGWINDLTGDPKVHGRVYLATGGRGIVYGDIVREQAPVITAHPVSLTQAVGSTASLTVRATASGAVTYQWYRQGVPLAGGTQQTLALSSIQISDAGDYTVKVTGPGGSVTSRLARVTVAVPTASRIANMSVRSVAGVGGNPLIVGLIMQGGAKQVLLRATGPALAAFKVEGTLDDPEMKVFRDSTTVASNDNWGDGGQSAALAAVFSQVGAFPLDRSDSKDAALLTTVDGSRTVHVNAVSAGQSGVVLLEAYDTEAGAAVRLINVSARNRAGVGAETLIAGFVIEGTAPKRVLVRGIGPSLGDFGVPNPLADPVLELNFEGRVVATNDNWADEPGAAAGFANAGAFGLPAGSKDAAILMTLPAGLYTAVVSGSGNTTGEALVEIYELSD